MSYISRVAQIDLAGTVTNWHQTCEGNGALNIFSGFAYLPIGNDTETAKSFLIGRSGTSDLTIDDMFVSFTHAIIEPDTDYDHGCDIWVGKPNYTIRDMKSKNGTTVNGKKIESGIAIKLFAGDRIILADRVVLTYRA